MSDMTLKSRFLEYCEQRGITFEKGRWRVTGRLISRVKLRGMVLDEWGDIAPNQVDQLIANREEAYATEQPTPEDMEAVKELYESTMNRIFKHFRWAIDPNGTVKTFARTCTRSWEVREIISQPTELPRDLRSALMVVYSEDPGELKRIQQDMNAVHASVKLEHGNSLEAWLRAGLNAKLLENPEARMENPPVPVSADPTEPCMMYVDMSLIVPGPHPAWDQVEEKLSSDEAKVFRAYLFSVFDPVNHGRQGLWIKGKEGTGKSTIILALLDIMREAAVALSPNSLNNQFWAAKIHRKRLALYADCKYLRFLTDGKFHSILGGDPVDVEHKHRNSETHRVHCRVIVGSNYSPEISMEAGDEVSRVIFIEMDNSRVDTSKYFRGKTLLGDGSFKDQLVSQFWNYLHDCRGAYIELCPTRQNLVLPESIQEKTRALCNSEEDDLFATLTEECFEFDQEAKINSAVFRNWVTKQSNKLGRDNQAMGRFYEYLEKYWDVTRGRERHHGKETRTVYLYGLRVVRDLPTIRTKRNIVTNDKRKG